MTAARHSAVLSRLVVAEDPETPLRALLQVSNAGRTAVCALRLGSTTIEDRSQTASSMACNPYAEDGRIAVQQAAPDSVLTRCILTCLKSAKKGIGSDLRNEH